MGREQQRGGKQRFRQPVQRHTPHKAG
jgi:hypothetical protein